MSLHLIFDEIINKKNQEKYVSEKLELFFGIKKNLAENVRTILRRSSYDSPSIVSKDKFPKLSKNEEAIIKISSKCLINDINKVFHLAEGEYIIEDFISYLEHDFRDYQKGTPLLYRKTNMGVFYILETSFRIINSRLINKPSTENTPSLIFVGDTSTDLLVSFAKGLAGAVGGKVGSALLDVLFGASNSINFAQLESDLALIVKNANAEQTIAEQGGKINGIIEDINTYYKERKSKGLSSKSELYSEQREYEKDINKSLGILRREEFKTKGLSTFIGGANVMIDVLQEMCIQDPQYDIPKDSSNYNVIISDLTTYINYVKNLHDQELKNRLDQIGEVYNKPFVDINAYKALYYYHDSFDNKTYGPFESHNSKDDPEQRANDSRNQLILDLTNSMTWMLEVVANWEEVKKNPLG